MASIQFHYADIPALTVNGKRKIKTWLKQLMEEEQQSLSVLDYVFCSDEYLLNINRQFLQHDYYTDIITFDLSEPSASAIKGEIYISIDRVKENAMQQGVSFLQELLRVIAHGALHLCGYGDKKKSEITIMRAKEDYYLLKFGDE